MPNDAGGWQNGELNNDHTTNNHRASPIAATNTTTQINIARIKKSGSLFGSWFGCFIAALAIAIE